MDKRKVSGISDNEQMLLNATSVGVAFFVERFVEFFWHTML